MEECVLAVLGSAADGVEGVEVLGGSVALGDGVGEDFLDFEGFAFEHGGLVGDSDLLEVLGGVELR